MVATFKTPFLYPTADLHPNEHDAFAQNAIAYCATTVGTVGAPLSTRDQSLARRGLGYVGTGSDAHNHPVNGIFTLPGADPITNSVSPHHAAICFMDRSPAGRTGAEGGRNHNTLNHTLAAANADLWASDNGRTPISTPTGVL